MSKVKQVIVMRSDLKNTDGNKVSTGKLLAQAAHASMAVILNKMQTIDMNDNGILINQLTYQENSPVDIWLNGPAAKIFLKTDSESGLLDIYEKAIESGLPVALITDNGLTEFGGTPTNTCVAIGPAYSDDIDIITGKLILFT